MSKQDVFVNSLKLRVGDYVEGGPPGTAMIAVHAFDRSLKVTLVRDLSTDSLIALIGDSPSQESMGSKEFSILAGTRIVIKPREQIDYAVSIELVRPTEVAGKYKKIWDIGANWCGI